MSVRCVGLLVLFGVCGFQTEESVAAPPELTLPVVDSRKHNIEHIESILFDPGTKKVYVGTRSRDADRSGLMVFDTDADGKLVGTARKYSDHPDKLPIDHHSTILCFALNPRHRKLFFGVSATHKEHARPLVMYDLDRNGEPTGKPRAFDIGNPHHACNALTFHPQLNRLYAVGWGGDGFFTLDQDKDGKPEGKPVRHHVGGHGKYSLSIRSDGTKIYLGTYPSILEVCDLDKAGNLTGKPRTFAIPDGPKQYLLLTTSGERAVYFKGSEGKLAYLPLNDSGEPEGEVKQTSDMSLQRVTLSSRPDHLLLAVATGFPDALTGKWITNGMQVREVVVKKDGTPGETVRESAVQTRFTTAALSHGPGIALGTNPMERGFLGNRFAGLQLRTTLVSAETRSPLPPATVSIALSKQQVYARPVFSAKHERVYLAGEHGLATASWKTGDGAVTTVACANASGLMAVDDARGLVYVACKDGSVAVRKLSKEGLPEEKGESHPSGMQEIRALVVHPRTHRLYVLGTVGKEKPAEFIVPVSCPGHVNEVVLDAERSRLYVCHSYHGNENLAVYHLNDAGTPEDKPHYYADGFKTDDKKSRGILSAMRVDAKRRKLYLGGHLESSTKEGWLVVYDLDDKGDPTGSPRLYASENSRGSVLALELSPGGDRLYDSGWGDPRVFARKLDAKGEPTKESVAWAIGGQGKSALHAVGSNLIVGTYPSTVEVIRLRPDGSAFGGLTANLSGEKQTVKLGFLREGEPGDWHNLDDVLKDGVGTALLRCHLSGAEVVRAQLKFETALLKGTTRTPLRTVSLEVAGNTAGLFLPHYGVDDPGLIADMVQTSAERYRHYRSLAEKYAIPPEERPKQFVVANGLIGVDSSKEALEDGMKVLGLLGHNTAQIWNWPGIAPEAIRASARQNGIDRFRHAVYNPPSYFDFNVEKVQPDFLDRWADDFRKTAAGMGAKPEELALFHMADEPGWYFPKILQQIREKPEYLAVFRKYLQSKGFQPQDFGKKSWDEVFPMPLSNAKTLPEKRLLFWTARYCTESLSIAFAAANAALQRRLNANLSITANLNNWPGHFFIPSPGKKIANNSDTSADAAMGMPDWFDLGRKKAVSCLWTEDWFADQEAQLWSMYGDLLRCAAREGNVNTGAYVVGHSTGSMAEGGKYKFLAAAGHGVRTFDPYIFGPNPAFADGWSEKEHTYRSLSEGIRLLGKTESLLYPGKARAAQVAVLMPQAAQVWDGDASTKCYLRELYGLHFALTHENLAVDFIDDIGVEEGQLKKFGYRVLYVTAPNLSAKAQQAVLAWVREGGTLGLLPGACGADEYNEPCNVLTAVTGVKSDPVPRVAPPHHSHALRLARIPIAGKDRLAVEDAYAVVQTVPLTATEGNTLAGFPDGKAAMIEIAVGKGRIVSYGFWPGVTYWLSPDRSDHTRLPQHWSSGVRKLATAPVQLSGITRDIEVSEPGVEAILLESPQGTALVLLNWTGTALKEITLTLRTKDNFASIAGIESGPLKGEKIEGGLKLKVPLRAVEVVMMK